MHPEIPGALTDWNPGQWLIWKNKKSLGRERRLRELGKEKEQVKKWEKERGGCLSDLVSAACVGLRSLSLSFINNDYLFENSYCFEFLV